MQADPAYYRQQDEFYHAHDIVLTKNGTFPIDIERYLGQAGADFVHGIGKSLSDQTQYTYAPFVHVQNKHFFVDITKPTVRAFYETFTVPCSVGKKTVKASKKPSQVMKLISVVGGLVIFASLYVFVRDTLKVTNSFKIIQRGKNLQKFLEGTRKEDKQVSKDPVFKTLAKIVGLREKMYKRNLISGLIGLALATAIVASMIFTTVVCFAAPPLIIPGLSLAGAALVGMCMKTSLEWNGRMDRAQAKNILDETEYLRTSSEPMYLSRLSTSGASQFLHAANAAINH